MICVGSKSEAAFKLPVETETKMCCSIELVRVHKSYIWLVWSSKSLPSERSARVIEGNN